MRHNNDNVDSVDLGGSMGLSGPSGCLSNTAHRAANIERVKRMTDAEVDAYARGWLMGRKLEVGNFVRLIEEAIGEAQSDDVQEALIELLSVVQLEGGYDCN